MATSDLGEIRTARNSGVDVPFENNTVNNNVTGLVTTLESVVNSGGRPQWRRILDIIQIILLIWGISTNLGSALCFREQPEGFSHNRVHDSGVTCLLGSWSLLFWLYYVHDRIVYWVVASNSYYGLVLIAMDRYLAVVKSITYKTITVTKILVALLIIYLLNILVFVWPFALLVKMDGDKCVAGYTLKGEAGVVHGKVHAVVMTAYHYVLPCLLFMGLYGQAIYTLKKKKKEESAVEGSATVERASAQIVKAAIAVTGIFMCTIGKADSFTLLTFFSMAKNTESICNARCG